MKNFLAGCGLLISCGLANLCGATITYTTPTGSTVPGSTPGTTQPVSASATFTTTTGLLTISLSDLLANPTDVGQLISDLDFTLSSGLTGTTTFTESASLINIGTGGTVTSAGTTTSGYEFGTFSGGFTICTVCPAGTTNVAGTTAGPANLIIGPGPYTNANGSIANNMAHNPFINQTATFTLANSGISSTTTVTSATFSFGTTAGVNVGGGPGGQGGQVPEPGSMYLMGAGLTGLGLFARKFRKA